MTDDEGGWDDLFDPAPPSPEPATALRLFISEDDWIASVHSIDRARPTPDAPEQPETGSGSVPVSRDDGEQEQVPASVPQALADSLETEEEAREIDRFMEAIGSLDEVQAQEDGLTLFGSNDDFRIAWQLWKGMPEFNQSDLSPYRSIMVHFASQEDVDAFAALIDQKLPSLTSSRGVWFPKPHVATFVEKRYRSVEEGDE